MVRRTIPQIRDRISALAQDVALLLPDIAAELRALAEETKRRPPVRMAPRKAQGVTDVIRAQVWAYAAKHPTATMREIGRLHGIDQGRVSEILAGKRGEA